MHKILTIPFHHEIDPLICSRCNGPIGVISFIEDEQLIRKILKHLDLWHIKHKPPPCANGPPPKSFIIYDQSSAPSADNYLIDADYQIETYL
jgi:hypothetical protein